MKIFNIKNNWLMQYAGERKNRLSLSGVSIQADWYALLAIIILILVALVASSVSLYRGIERDLAATEEAAAGAMVKINEVRMRAVLDDLLERRHLRAAPAESVPVEDESVSVDEQWYHC